MAEGNADFGVFALTGNLKRFKWIVLLSSFSRMAKLITADTMPRLRRIVVVFRPTDIRSRTGDLHNGLVTESLDGKSRRALVQNKWLSLFLCSDR